LPAPTGTRTPDQPGRSPAVYHSAIPPLKKEVRNLTFSVLKHYFRDKMMHIKCKQMGHHSGHIQGAPETHKAFEMQ
jgi:hypothetical protein